MVGAGGGLNKNQGAAADDRRTTTRACSRRSAPRHSRRRSRDAGGRLSSRARSRRSRLSATVRPQQIMSSKKCSHCGLFNPESTQRCDCGYDFDARELRSPPVTLKSASINPDWPTIVRVALWTPLCAGLALIVGITNELEGQVTMSASWILVGCALLAAVVVPGLHVARIARSNRFANGCRVALAGWSMQLVSTTFIGLAAGEEGAGIAAAFLWMSGTLAGLVTGWVAVFAGRVVDARRAV